jgi:dihydrofolate synthase/folylpolyglutamate synthase
VIEVGLGGRLDATNIISPDLSVITNIGRDHTEILGDTIVAIATEKAGIIKKNTPIIIGESHPETKPVFLEFSSRLKAPITFADGVYRIDYSMLSTDNYQVFNVKKSDEIRYTNLKCGLLGHYQRKNTVTLLAALDVLRPLFTNIHDKAVYEGIKNVILNTGLQGRWQLIRNNPKVICDTAHNSDGLKWVLQQVNDTPFKRLHLIIGFVNDKDTSAILQTMPVNALYYFVRLSVPRTMDETVLASQAARSGLKGHAFSGISGAYESAMQIAEKDDLIVVTGSNFLVADFLEMH